MNLLLDTNALLWWLEGSSRVGQDAREAIADANNPVHVSAASAWEIAIKVATGRLATPPDVSRWLPSELETNGFLELPVTIAHALEVETLPRHHRDPFDRLLIAQARVEDLWIVTGDGTFKRYDVRVFPC